MGAEETPKDRGSTAIAPSDGYFPHVWIAEPGKDRSALSHVVRSVPEQFRRRLGRFRRSEIARGYSAFAGIDAINLIVDAATRFIIGGLLGATALGSFSLIVAMAAVVQQFFDLRIGNFTTRYVTEWLQSDDQSKVAALVKLSYWIDALTGLLAFGILMVSANWITGNLYDAPQLSQLLRVYAFVGLSGTIQHTSNGVLKAAARYKWITGPTVAMRLLELAAIALIGTTVRSLFAIFLAIALKEAVSSVISAWLASRALTESGVSVMGQPMRVLAPHRREFTSFIFNTNLASYATVVASKLDVLILGRVIPLADLGVYRLAVSIATCVALLTQPIRQTLLQVFVRAKHSKRRILRLIRITTLFAGSLAIATATTISLLGSQVISAVLGEHQQVTGLLWILSLRHVLEALAIWSVPLLFAMDLLKVVGRRSVMYLVIYPLLLVPLARVGGELGAASALLLATAVVTMYSGAAGLRHLKA